MSEEDLTVDQIQYIKRLANRLVQFRRSASIDADDLIAAAHMRWWGFRLRNHEEITGIPVDVLFRQQVKFAMRDVIRDSSPVRVTRTYQAQLQAYEQPYTVSLDHLIDVQAGGEPIDKELWMDVTAGIGKLSQRDQIILSLSVEQGYSFTEIAYVMDVSVSTVTRAYHKAIDFLRKDITQTNDTRTTSRTRPSNEFSQFT